MRRPSFRSINRLSLRCFDEATVFGDMPSQINLRKELFGCFSGLFLPIGGL